MNQNWSANSKPKLHRTLISLKDSENNLLVAVATLGLLATIVDGEPDYQELRCFLVNFRRNFFMTDRESNKILRVALTRIRQANGIYIINQSCDTLNVHLDSPRKLKVFDNIANILVADKQIEQAEEYYLDYLAERLKLTEELKM